jgi:hypothetical protein
VIHPQLLVVDVNDETIRAMFTLGIAAILAGVGYLIRQMRQSLEQLDGINRAVDGDRRLRLPGLMDRMARVEEQLANATTDHVAIQRIDRRVDEVHKMSADTQQMLRDHLTDPEAHEQP